MDEDRSLCLASLAREVLRMIVRPTLDLQGGGAMWS